jgi:hypothetical protein
MFVSVAIERLIRHQGLQPLSNTTASMSGQAANQQPCKKQKLDTSVSNHAQDDELKRFYRSWAWKREHR